MRERWDRKKKSSRKSKKGHDNYTLLDRIIDVLLWIPEIIIFPFRLIIWLFRVAGRLVKDVFDVV